eukprot:403361125
MQQNLQGSKQPMAYNSTLSINVKENNNNNTNQKGVVILDQQQNKPKQGMPSSGWGQSSFSALSPIKGTYNYYNSTLDNQEQQDLKRLDSEFSKLGIKEIRPIGGNLQGGSSILSQGNRARTGNNQMINDSSSDDFMPMVYEIEEVECRMTDIEERDQKHDSAENNMNRSISVLSHTNLAMFENNMKQFQDLLRYDTDRNLDISMSSVCSTPRYQNILPQDMIDMNDSRYGYDMMSSSNGAAGMSNMYRNMQSPGGQGHGSSGYRESSNDVRQGRIGSNHMNNMMGRTMDNLNMTPRMHEQNKMLYSSQRFNDSGLLNQNMHKHGSATSERIGLQNQRSSAETSEIERELNKHQRIRMGSNSIDKNYDPEAMKKQLQISMQIQLQNLVNKINEKEKQYIENEKQYSKLQQQLNQIDKKTQKVETQLKDETNLNVKLRTQMNFLLQTQFGVDKVQKMLQRFMKGNQQKQKTRPNIQ